jgi:hypothetical protein
MSGISPVPRRRRTLENWAGLGAVAYVLLFTGGLLLASLGQPDTSDPPAKLISYFSDSGHRDKIYYGWLIVVIGVFFFIWFVAALRQALRRIDPDGLLTNVATAGGIVYAALTLAGFSLETAIKTMSDDTFRHQVYPGLIHAADDAGYVMHSGGDVGLAALIVATSLAAWRAARIPAWAGWIGVISGILAVFSIFFFPQILIALWLLAAGIVLFRAAPAPVAP